VRAIRSRIVPKRVTKSRVAIGLRFISVEVQDRKALTRFIAKCDCNCKSKKVCAEGSWHDSCNHFSWAVRIPIRFYILTARHKVLAITQIAHMLLLASVMAFNLVQ
jgi:hypothetical protein